MESKEKLYKGKYLIALYNDNDYPVGVYASPREIAECYNKSVESVRSTIGRIFNKRKNMKRIFKCNVYFIEA